MLSAGVLILSVFVATRFGLVALIARGYRTLAYLFIAVYVVPLLAYGVWSGGVRSRAAGVSP
jgi:uncharacterized membrane protein YkvI